VPRWQALEHHDGRHDRTGRTIAAETELRSAHRPLHDAADVHGYVRRICFKTGPPTLVGAELEWMVARTDDPTALVPLDDLRALVDPARLAGGSSFTLEPGGQVELSSAASPDLTTLCRDLGGDVAVLTDLLSGAGLALVPFATDPGRPPVRQLSSPRYDAMAAYFDTLPHELGRVMMCSTAAVQVNLDTGADDADVARRCRLLGALGPPLVAAFANSPARAGHLTGWRSTRQAVWQGMEPRRTHAPVGDDPVAAWADYALAAPLMMLRRPDAPWVAAPGFTFGAWVAGQVPGLPHPTEDDLAHHLTTLFPPVRPRGWFEVRYLDAQHPTWWPVPVVVLATALEHDDLHDPLLEACRPVAGSWLVAARAAVADRALHRAASEVLDLVTPRLEDAALRRLVDAFRERYLARGRCPADDADEESR
jgi:glutamate--cysteine ligase